MNKSILVAGSTGFIGKNLLMALKQLNNCDIHEYKRGDSYEELFHLSKKSEIIFYLIGINRTSEDSQFQEVNSCILNKLCKDLADSGAYPSIIFTSSIQAGFSNPYGASKLMAENALINYSKTIGDKNVAIYRLPGVFGKWAKPNYNSVVATFCHNIANDLPIEIRDPSKLIPLVYIDDLLNDFIHMIYAPPKGLERRNIHPEHSISLKRLAEELYEFRNMHFTCHTPSFCDPFTKALYSTYLSYVPIQNSTYPIFGHNDNRGTFVEIFKQQNAGQLSYFTAKPGITRGGHFHHSKIEKFLVTKGSAKFRFTHVITHEKFEVCTSASAAQIVQTFPGWAHDITNIGNDEMMAIVWSNDIFDPSHPDTIKSDVQ